MGALFSATLFLSSALYFVVQPMLGKMLLPALGGSPAAWLACALFFQAMLLVGYRYAHWAARRLDARLQLAVHACVVLAPLAVLPLSMSPGGPPAGAGPVAWLLASLAATAALPCFALSANSPLLQRWFSRTDHPRAADPYFLFSAGNLGSLLALIGYPLLIEPYLGLSEQSRLWARCYAVLACLVAACGWLSRRRGDAARPEVASADAPLSRRLRWAALAFIPSSLMLGMTFYVTTDVAAAPLLWVIPLAVYLVSFIAGFSVKRVLYPAALAAGTLLALTAFMELEAGIWPVLLAHSASLFVIGSVFHGALARERPAAAQLTGFYWWLSVGGALGGLFNAVLAPLLFKTALEYRLTMALAAVLLPMDAGEAPEESVDARDWALALALGAATGLLGYACGRLIAGGPPGWAGKCLHLAFTVIMPSLACYSQLRRPLRFRLGLGSVLLAAAFLRFPAEGKTLHRERSFFGALGVTEDSSGGTRTLVHGSTIHGRQSTDPRRRLKPLMYYHEDSPIGKAFAMLKRGRGSPDIAVVGLGAGGLACYAQAGQRLTFYELDPAVERIARDARFFTYLKDAEARGARLSVVLGDARRRLAQEAPGRRYGLIILDAFTSDAIPAHLLTREALRLYLSRLEEHGIAAFHVSNRYLRLDAMLGALAEQEGLAGLVGKDEADPKTGKAQSTWVFLARKSGELDGLRREAGFRTLEAPPGTRGWTDERSSLLRLLKF